jgi:GTP-binding protein Era
MTRCGHVGLAGVPNVGKSSLLNRLVGTHLAIVSPKAQATRLPVVGLRTEGEAQLVLHDLPGLLEPAYLMQERMRHLAEQALPRMDVILHLHPAPDLQVPDFLALARLPAPPRAVVLTVLTKADQLTPAGRDRLPADALLVSSSTGEGIPALLRRVVALLPERPFEFDPDDVGTQPLRFFVVEYLREAAFELLDEELPYSITAEVEEFREQDRPVYIRVTLFVERDSQKGIVIGRGAEMLKRIGGHARARLEQLLGEAVYLDTRVKVLPKWRRNPAALARFGFPEVEERRR